MHQYKLGCYFAAMSLIGLFGFLLAASGTEFASPVSCRLLFALLYIFSMQLLLLHRKKRAFTVSERECPIFLLPKLFLRLNYYSSTLPWLTKFHCHSYVTSLPIMSRMRHLSELISKSCNGQNRLIYCCHG